MSEISPKASTPPSVPPASNKTVSKTSANPPPKPTMLPSIGFLIICATYAVAVAFFIWGFQKPRLDQIWELHHTLKTGETSKLSAEESSLLSDALVDYPELAGAMLSGGNIGVISASHDGWIGTPNVTILRTPQAKKSILELDAQTADKYLPFKLNVSGDGWKKKLEIDERKRYRIELPTTGKSSELIALKIKGKALRNDPSSLALRLSFTEPGAAAPQPEAEE